VYLWSRNPEKGGQRSILDYKRLWKNYAYLLLVHLDLETSQDLFFSVIYSQRLNYVPVLDRCVVVSIVWMIHKRLTTYCSSTFFERLREHLKIHTRPPSQNSNLGHFKYEAGVLVTEPRFLMNLFFWNIEALLFTKRLAHPVKHNRAYLCPCLQAHRGCPSCRWWKPQWSWWMSAGTAWGLDHSRSRTGRRSRCCPRYLETSARDIIIINGHILTIRYILTDIRFICNQGAVELTDFLYTSGTTA
jgi:hypothetical protein